MKLKYVVIFLFVVTSVLILEGQSAVPGTPANPSLFELRYQASQIAASFPVDLETARKWVPPAWNLAVDQSGMAKGLVTIISYPNHGLLTTPNSPRFEEGQNIAPAAVAHFWFALAGPVEVLPVPGAAVTTPTSYFYDVADFVTSKTAHAVFRRAGRPAILVRDISLVSWGSGLSGEITFMNGRKVTLDAIATTTLPTPLVLGGNAWQWHAGGLGHMGNDNGIRLDPVSGYPSNVNTTRVQFVALISGPPGGWLVTIHADPGTEFQDCFGMSEVWNAPATFFSPTNIVLNGGVGELSWTSYPASPIPVPPALP